MLNAFFKGPLQLGLAQAAVAALAAIVVALLAGRRGIHLETDTMVALLRGAIQIVAGGSILVILLRGPRWTSGLLLAAMIVAAGATSRKRAKMCPAFKVSTYAIVCGAGSVIAIMTWLGVIDTAITT
jgi:UDP-glucose/iron transport system permease protein